MTTKEGGLRHDVNTRISAEDLERLLEVAAREERSNSAILRRALRQYLADQLGEASLDTQRRK